jgi:hypothetical protein
LRREEWDACGKVNSRSGGTNLGVMFHSFHGRLPEADSLHSKMQFNGRSDVADLPL